ncbi:MAG: Uma2 family endonuclease [Leptolyngbyaceae cyanobacterium bins.302]|nr:Uma2 family endonuclease [Leptolyngbyaceae cyanobacterium bins.302]
MTQSIDQAAVSQSAIAQAAIADTTDEIQFPPGDLWSDEPPLESDLHREQIELLIRLLKWHWRNRQGFYVSGNVTIYYSPNQLKSEDFRGPDFFVVLGAEPRERKSWVGWQEVGKYPNMIVELISGSTATDRGLKKQIYQDTFRTLDYFWFHPNTLEFQGFHLIEGQYQPIAPTPEGWLWSQQLELYLGIHNDKLRLFTTDGTLIESPEDELQRQVEEERQRTAQERQRAEQAEQELDRLREILRS